MASSGNIEAKNLTPYLSWALGTDVRAIRATPLMGGVHQNIRVDLDSSPIRSVVVRRAPPKEKLGYARQVVPYDLETEFLALYELNQAGHRTPCVWGLDLEGRFLGASAFLMEYVEGPTVLEAVSRTDPRPILESFATAICGMNRILPTDVPSVVSRRGAPRKAPVDLVAWLETRTQNIQVPVAIKNGIDRLRRNEPEGRPVPAFGNGDLNPQNAIMSSDGNVVLIDWEYVGFNDPIAELMLLHAWPIGDPFLEKHPLDRIYCELSGVNPHILPWYELLATISAWVYALADRNTQGLEVNEERCKSLMAAGGGLSCGE